MYFPPNNSDQWDTIAPSSLNWCDENIADLNEFLESSNSRAFILLIDGKIVLEEYFGGHTSSTDWYWASAGKTLTAFMVGMAQQEGLLNISESTSTYLGQGWSNCSAAQEEQITIQHQLSMTTGLDDQIPNSGCTDDTCLLYLADPEIRWAYHNGPYTLLEQVIANATSTSLNDYTTQKVKNPIGMNGLYIPVDYNRVFFSTARSMARFGLLNLNQGYWDGSPIMSDSTYHEQMINTSQSLNEAYGFLWWLNGKSTFMVPQSQIVFQGNIMQNAPSDTYSAQGKDGQIINVVPSRNMVWIRMGLAPDNSLISLTLNDEIWEYINNLPCDPLSNIEVVSMINNFTVHPNPVNAELKVICNNEKAHLVNFKVFNQLGSIQIVGKSDLNMFEIDLKDLTPGIYFVELKNGKANQLFKIRKD